MVDFWHFSLLLPYFDNSVLLDVLYFPNMHSVMYLLKNENFVLSMLYIDAQIVDRAYFLSGVWI